MPPRSAPTCCKVEPQCSYFVSVDEEFRLWLIDLDIDLRRKGEHAALRGLHLQLFGEIQDLYGIGCRGQYKFNRELSRLLEAPAA